MAQLSRESRLSGEIRDAKTIATLMLAQLRGPGL